MMTAVGAMFECQRRVARAGADGDRRFSRPRHHAGGQSAAGYGADATRTHGRESAAMLLARIGGDRSVTAPLDVGFEIAEGGSI